MPKIYTQKYMSNLLKITISDINRILKGKQHTAWSLAKKLAELTSTNPAIWADNAPEVAEKRQRAILREELQISKNQPFVYAKTVIAYGVNQNASRH